VKPSNCRSSSAWFSAAVIVGGSAAIVANAASGIPDPCKLITVAEMQQIVGPLRGAPKASDPSSGEINCSYTPVSGPDFIDVSLQDGDLIAMRRRDSQKDAMSLSEFGKDAFVNPAVNGFADLYAKKGNLILRVTLPKGSRAVDTAKAIARKALPRL
jgi:hypothetical protein